VTRVLVSAGERSGDAHAGAVVRALRTLDPNAAVDAVGGEALRGAGARLLEDVDTLSAIGEAEIVGAVPHHLRLLRRLDAALERGAYDVVLLVDYPGFHLRLARRAAAHGVPVLYYIAPQIWAWGAWRTRLLRETVRHLALILPFEEPFFRERNVPCTFVGHPLLDQPPLPNRGEARSRLGIGDPVPLLALFPGSRPSERGRHWRPFTEAAALARRARPDLRIVIAGQERDYPGLDGEVEWCADPRLALAAADAALCKSGTSTLEAALAGTPMVVAYRLHPLTYLAARALVQVPHVALVNLVAGRAVVPEILQGRATPERLCAAVLPLVDPQHPSAERQRTALGAIAGELGTPGAAQRVAELTLRVAA
jgi:lipid-A-disaccharide synthase